MLKRKIRTEIKKAAEKVFGKIAAPNFILEAPDETAHGDYYTNLALLLAKNLKKNPLEIADLLKAELEKKSRSTFSKIETALPGFINFWLSPEILGKELRRILKEKEKYGAGAKKKQTIVVEYSSPNIAKPLGVHHLRSTIIGQALVNLLRFAGYKVVSLSFPGDWGTQFGLLIAGYKRWGNPQKIKANPVREMLELYVKFSQAAKENPKLLDEGRAEFKKLEEGDKENLKLWKWFLKESLKDFARVYKMLGVKIENTIGESFYEPELKKLVGDALKKGLAQKNEDGSVVIPIPGSKTPEIIQKSDGATIYATRELAAIRHRLKKWRASRILYVAANQQTFHLAQVFAAAQILGFAKKENLAHIKFGMMLDKSGKKFATREGKLIPLEELLEEAVSRAQEVVDRLNPAMRGKEKKKVAKIVGIGAVKFFELSQNRLSDIIFDWDKMLNLKGATAPYIQYSFARLRSILRQGGGVPQKFDAAFLDKKEERAVLRRLLYFPEVAEDAAKRCEPNCLASYLVSLAEEVNAFYESSPVLKAEGPARGARLALAEATSLVLKNGLNLLGIEAPERM